MSAEEHQSETTPLILHSSQTDIIVSPDTNVSSDGETNGELGSAVVGIIATGFLSFGCHFASHLLGPLKAQIMQNLQVSETVFAALLSSFQVINSITPLIGFVVPRLGLAKSALICTSIIALGQLIVYLSALRELSSGMLLGYFVTGLGISPVAIVQESIILAHFGKGVRGKSMGLSLLLGKLGSWVASIIAVPLSSSWGPNSPFDVSLGLCLGSVLSAVTFARLSHTSRTRAPLTSPRSVVRLKETILFGDQFWLYVLLCALCGALWFPFIHLSTDILSTLFGSSAKEASRVASLLLFTPLFIYPTLGYFLDHYPRHTSPPVLLSLGSLCTLATLLILAASKVRETFGQVGAMTWFSIGRGSAPLLLVAVLPKIVINEHFSTALGIHKAIEMAGSTVSQTVTGAILSHKSNDRTALMVQLVKFFIFLNLIEFLLAIVFARLHFLKSRDVRSVGTRQSHGMVLRGHLGLSLALTLILGSWISFLWAIVN